MNLREAHLSSRSVIPVALALPVNRGPLDVREHEALQRRRRAADGEQQPSPSSPASIF